MSIHNIFENLPTSKTPEELFGDLATGQQFKLKKIISTGHITPDDEWYDQAQTEWVMLLQGQATLLFDDEREVIMKPGDFLTITPHEKHRVTHTSDVPPTVWLALYFDSECPF